MKSIIKFLKIIICLVLLIAIIFSTITISKGYSMYKDAISAKSLTDKVAEIRSLKNYVKLESIPKTYQDAVVSVEDHRFYSHNGFDYIATGRAVILNIQKQSLVAGGSTITQQLAKNMYFTQEKTFARKVAELFVVNKLEHEYSKNDILEMYLNVIYFGDNYIGIGEASKGYFNKKPSELTLEEQTLLAGLPNAPSVYALSTSNKLAKERQSMVIDAMVKYNKLSNADAEKIKNKKSI